MKPAELLREEYVALRAEICQSIAKQHHITLAGYGITSAAFGYLISSSNVDCKVFMVIPLLLAAMISLWAVECNRMVRASYYIAYVLWPELCALAERKNIGGWETWIRLPNGNVGRFCKYQNYLQQIVIVIVPFILSITSVFIVAIDVREDPMWSWTVKVFGITLIFLWYFFYRIIGKLSNLAALVPSHGLRPEQPPPDFPLNKKIP